MVVEYGEVRVRRGVGGGTVGEPVVPWEVLGQPYYVSVIRPVRIQDMVSIIPDSKLHWANGGPTIYALASVVNPTKLAIRDVLCMNLTSMC